MATKSEQPAGLPNVALPVLENTLPLVNEKEKCLTCTVCLDNFKEPKVLPCCHTFCKSCLERILEKAKVKTNLVCPQCRAEHTVPPNGPEGFLTDFSLLHGLNYELPKSETGRSHDICGECDSSDTAVAFCTECQSYLCSSCASIHKKLKHFRNHKVTSMESLDYEEVKAQASATTLYCREHPEEPLKVFCLTCQVLVCLHCIIGSHQLHKLGQISEDVRKEVQTKLETLCEHARQNLAKFEGNLKYIKKVEEVVASRPASLQTAINKTFDSFVATLEARRLQLLKEAEGRSNKDLKEIWAEKEFVEAIVVGLNSALTFTDRTLTCSRDIELLSMSTQATSRLTELKDRKWNQATVQNIDVKKLNFVQGNPTAYLAKLGQLEEGVDLARAEVEIVIKNLPSVCQLGTCTDLLVVGRIGDYNLKSNDITISVVYGKSNKRKTIEAQNPQNKKSAVSCVVPFTATCGGKHCIAVSLKGAMAKLLRTVKGKTMFEFTTTVRGRPTVGAVVCRGPDWNYYDDDDDAGTGIVENYQEVNKIDVYWNGCCYSFNWGEKVGYDVELVK